MPSHPLLGRRWPIAALVIGVVLGLSLSTTAVSNGAAETSGNPRISGTVTDTNGNPVAGVAVWAYRASDTWLPTLQATTDASGNYVLDRAGLGIAYRIRFGPPFDSNLVPEWYGGPKRSSSHDVRLSSAQPTADIDAELALGGSLIGSVVGAAGTPLANALVWVFRSDDTWVGTYAVRTGADGTYRINGIDPTTQIRIRFDPPIGSGLAFEWFDDVPRRSSATPIVVTAGQIVNAGQAQLVGAASANPVRLSVSPGGAQLSQDVIGEGLSDDGKKAILLAAAPTLSSDYPYGIYERDLATGTLTLVSVDAKDPGRATSALGTASVSADGRFVAFDLNSNPWPSGSDVFVRDMVANTTVRASVTPVGESPTGSSFEPSLSADGRHVAFVGCSGDQVAPPVEGPAPLCLVYMRNLATNQTTNVSATSSGGPPDGVLRVAEPSIDRHGSRVAFWSDARNITQPAGHAGVYLRDIGTASTQRIDVTATGAAPNADADQPSAISDDGRYVAFVSSASDLTPGDTDDLDVFLRDTVTKTTLNITGAGLSFSEAHGSLRLHMNGDAHYITFEGRTSTGVSVYRYNRLTGAMDQVVAPGTLAATGYGVGPDVSADGQVLFTLADDRLPGDTNGKLDVYVAGSSQPPRIGEVSLSAIPATQTVRAHVTLLATLQDGSNKPLPDTLVTFQVSSGPDGGFAAIVRTDSVGTAGALLQGKAAGTDTAIAFCDTNMNGVADAGEASATAMVTWRDPYAALGDSYSAGEGAGSYLPGTDSPQSPVNLCHRSSRSYASLLDASESLGSMAFRACSGAITEDLFRPNSEGNLTSSGEPEPAQLCGAQAATACPSGTTPWLSDKTSTVTLTIGGNDVGFSEVLKTCIQAKIGTLHLGGQCLADPTLAKTVRDRISTLAGTASATTPEGKPVHALSEVLAAIHQLAPNARVYLAGYPRFFGDYSGDCKVGTVFYNGLSANATVNSRDASTINTYAGALNAAIKAAANRAGPWAVWVDPAVTFAGHGYCDTGVQWFNNLDAGVIRDFLNHTSIEFLDRGSFHPNAKGYESGYKPAFISAGL
jgi:Tol biopolymer transport system component